MRHIGYMLLAPYSFKPTDNGLCRPYGGNVNGLQRNCNSEDTTDIDIHQLH